MGAPAQDASRQSETEFLESLRSRYEAQGFSFAIAPALSTLPRFFGSYRPDATASKPGQNVAIEVKQHQSPSVQTRVRELRRLFEDRPDWQLHVVYMNAGPLQSIIIPAPSPHAIRTQIDEVRSLSSQGHRRAAFVMGWSLLEAALQSVDDARTSRPRTPGTVVQTLAMNGLISPQSEEQLRALIGVRNRIVHGDVAAEPSADDVALVLGAVEDTLAVDAA
jgi:hypothetical protein